jgi:SAM-dependent methyltransferase
VDGPFFRQWLRSTDTVVDVTAPWPLVTGTVDVVFSSNFFEHLPRKQDLQACLDEILRVLRPGGRMIAMGPNIRFCYQEYWDFIDHYLPLSDRSIAEAMELAGLTIERVVPRFLPHTTSKKRVPPEIVLRLYLAMPFFWPLFGRQFLVVARKPGA